jgi:hypothetical protein
MLEVRKALISGRRVTGHDKYQEYDDNGNYINRWSYAFEKKGLDRNLRVSVSIDHSKDKPLLIVTVIDLQTGGG